MRTGDSNLAIGKAAVDFNQAAPRDAQGAPIVSQIFSDADRQTILKGMLDQCDALDGLTDGMIENVAQCRFRPAQLVCKPGQASGCLSQPQATALERGVLGFDIVEVGQAFQIVAQRSGVEGVMEGLQAESLRVAAAAQRL